MTTIAKFTTRFNRRCDRCARMVKIDHQVYRLASGECVCQLCARRAEPWGLEP